MTGYLPVNLTSLPPRIYTPLRRRVDGIGRCAFGELGNLPPHGV